LHATCEWADASGSWVFDPRSWVACWVIRLYEECVCLWGHRDRKDVSACPIDRGQDGSFLEGKRD